MNESIQKIIDLIKPLPKIQSISCFGYGTLKDGVQYYGGEACHYNFPRYWNTVKKSPDGFIINKIFGYINKTPQYVEKTNQILNDYIFNPDRCPWRDLLPKLTFVNDEKNSFVIFYPEGDWKDVEFAQLCNMFIGLRTFSEHDKSEIIYDLCYNYGYTIQEAMMASMSFRAVDNMYYNMPYWAGHWFLNGTIENSVRWLMNLPPNPTEANYKPTIYNDTNLWQGQVVKEFNFRRPVGGVKPVFETRVQGEFGSYELPENLRSQATKETSTKPVQVQLLEYIRDYQKNCPIL